MFSHNSAEDKSSKIFLQNIDSNHCKSTSSNIIEVSVGPLPEKPIIQYDSQIAYFDSF